jgi:hypothetical protein
MPCERGRFTLVLYRQAVEANNSSDDTILVYLIELDDVSPSDE